MSDFAKLRRTVREFSHLTSLGSPEAELLSEGRSLLGDLVATDDWLPEEFAEPDPVRYRQYLLHCDADERFSVVSFVWGPDQATPIHNHTVWGLIGVLRGGERAEPFRHDANGALQPVGPPEILRAGIVDAVSPAIGDIHRVSNAFADRVSVSIHVYGGNIGAVRRSVFQPDGVAKQFISGYANRHLPNIWEGAPGD
jgi:predicted metal-dependent enzyme (double-stranded beta helix superfamily)